MRFPSTRSSLSAFVAFAAIGALASACNDVLGIGEPIPAATGGGGSTGSTSAGGSPTSTGGGGSATTSSGGAGGAGGAGGEGGTTTTTTTEPPCARPVLVVVPVKEDGPIFDGACNGAISPGSTPFANVGLGRGLFRFVLAEPIAKAFAEDRILGLQLRLSRAPTCGEPTPCNVKKPGTFEARPLRNDWAEGNGSGYSGADWCRRLPGDPAPQWGTPGADSAEDVLPGEPSGTIAFTDADEMLVIPLDPAKHKGWITPGNKATDWDLSVRVSRTDGVAVFVCVTREANTPDTAPRLVVTYCPE